MDDNLYKPPEAELIDPVSVENEFYVVSQKKYLVLFFITIGLYPVYWFYKNWSLYREKTGNKMWPVMRGIFSIFFTHSLFRLVDSRLKEKKFEYEWNPQFVATVYVLFAILGNILDRLSYKEIGSPVTDLLSLGVLPVVGWTLYKAQNAVNIVCEDPLGVSNNQFTWANIIWIVFGTILWGMILLGLYFMVFDPSALDI